MRGDGAAACGPMVRGPICGRVEVDPRDGTEVLVTGKDPSQRLPPDLSALPDGSLKSTLDEFLERALELGLSDQAGARSTRMNVMKGKYTNRHYIELWAQRLTELGRQGLLPPIGRKLERWEIQARSWADQDILSAAQHAERRARALRAGFAARASELRRQRSAASWKRPIPVALAGAGAVHPASATDAPPSAGSVTYSQQYASGEEAVAALHAAYGAPQPGLQALEAAHRSKNKARQQARSGREAAKQLLPPPEPELEPEPEPEYVLESRRRVDATHAALEAAQTAAKMARGACTDMRGQLSDASRRAFERVDTDRSGEIDKYELRTLCRELGIGMNVKQLKQAWGWMDKDGDGTIQLEEFDTWLFGDKSQDTTFGDTTGARVDVQLFDQFVNGLGIKDLVAEAAEMAEVAKQAADVAVAAAEEADGVEGKEAAWLELKRKEETLAAKGRERDEKRRLAQEDREQAQAALGGAAGAGAVSKLFGGGATGLSRSSALGQKAARQHHAAAAKAEYEMRLKALEGRQHAELIAPPQPLRLVRRAAMPDPNKPHVRKKRLTAPAEPDNGDGDRWLDQNGIPRQFRPTGPELLRSKDWHRHRELVGPRHLWRFVDSSVVYADEQSGTEYEDVSFEQLVPDMEVEVFWEEDQRYHKAVVQHTLCQKRFASANPSEWKNKLLLYPEFMTSGLEFEVLTGPVGMFGVVIGRRKHEPARSLEDVSQPLALTDDTRLASPQDEKQSETVMLDAVLTGAEATGRLTSDQVRLMRRNVEVGRFPATYYLVRLQDTYLAYTGEEQQWTVPATGWYDLEVVGAGGGAGYFQPGGRGARLRATFMLQGGEALYVLVGGASMRVRDCSGGGGGTFVALNDRKKPLMVAGGGGGTRGGRGDQPGGDASLSTNGGDGVGTFWAAGGKDGHGGHNAPIGHGNGGGGFLSGGNSEVEVHGPGPGRSFQDGGGCVYEAYEDGSTNLVGSGFGGGGGHGTQGGGGGGGYSGGGGGEGGGGGGSFVRLTAENVEKIHAVAPGRHGYVKVSWSLLQNGDTGHAEAAGKPMSFKVARFGPKDFEVRKKAVRCEPQMADHIDGCTNIEELGGKIGVVRRGGCSFVLKAQRLQAAGCVAVVVEFNAGEALEQLGDPKGMAKDVTVPVVSMHAEDMTTVLAAEDLLIKHGDKPADAWDDFAAAAKKKGHAAMMEKLLSNADNHGAYNREQTANRLKHKARIGMIMGANERKLTKAQQIMADGLQLELQRSRARPKHNPKALMDYVYDTWGARVRDGNLSRASKASYRPTMTDSDGAPITNNTPPESDVILGLFKQNVTDAQAEKLAELMPLSHNLRIVYLGKNRIGDAGCEALAEAIPLCHKLELISLKGNAFAEAGKTALRRALAHPYSTPGLRIDGAELGRGKLDIGKFRAKRAAAGGLGGEGANAKDWRGKSRTTTYKGGISSGGLARVSVGAIDQLGDLQLRQAETTSGGRYQHGT